MEAVEQLAMTSLAAAAVAIRPPVSMCGQLQLLGSNLGVAVLGPIVQQLMHAQQHELAVKAAQAKICQVLGLIAGTDVAIQRAQGEAEVLQQHLQEVEHWRALLVLVCQLAKAEQGLKESLGLLQAVEQQAGEEPPAQQHCGKDGVVVAVKDVVTVTDGCLACTADDVTARAAEYHGYGNVDHSTLSAEHEGAQRLSRFLALHVLNALTAQDAAFDSSSNSGIRDGSRPMPSALSGAGAETAVSVQGLVGTKDEPGCDVICDTKCNLACCAEHDKCFAERKCSAASWAGNLCQGALAVSAFTLGPLGAIVCAAVVDVGCVSGVNRTGSQIPTAAAVTLASVHAQQTVIVVLASAARAAAVSGTLALLDWGPAR
eukprot:gene2920-3207_t